MRSRDELPPRTGGLAPDFTLPALDGELFSLRSLRGRWTILFTWASW